MKKIILLLIVSLQSVVLFSQNPADVDLAFSYWGDSVDFVPRSKAVQNDGKILVGGEQWNSTMGILVRLNTDGSQDTTFDIDTGFDAIVFPIAIQPDGKILVGGNFTTFNGESQNRLIRLNTDGSKDYSFNIGTGFDYAVLSIAIQPDGKILAGGTFTSFNGVTQYNLIRLNTDGSKDTSFNSQTSSVDSSMCIAIQSDGKILVSGSRAYNGGSSSTVIRLNTDGSKDTTFNIETEYNPPLSYTIAIQPDGKILVGGYITTFNGEAQDSVIRLNTDGSKDTSFNIGTGFNEVVYSLAIQTDGKILVGGGFTTFNGVAQNKLIRLNTDGSKDTSFNIGIGFNSIDNVGTIAIQPDGKILVGGEFTTFNGVAQNNFIRLNTDGSKDTSFSIITNKPTFKNSVKSIAVQSDGKILVGGDFTTFNGVIQNKLIRLNTDGTKDTSFDIGTGFNGHVGSITIQPDGKILVGGGFTTFNGVTQQFLIRLNTDGSKDTNFNIGTVFNSFVAAIAIQPDGKILVGGWFNAFMGLAQNRLIRLNTDGSKDTSFNIGTGFNYLVETIAIQPDGKILVGGILTTFNGVAQNRLIRLNTDGTKDTSFDIGTGFNGHVGSITIQPDGKILVGGGFTTFNGVIHNKLIRLNTDGSKDITFDIETGFDSHVSSITIQTDGKILVGGYFTTFNGVIQNRLIRLNHEGSKDTTFDIGTGLNSNVETIAIEPDGKILVGGYFTTYNANISGRLIRLQGTTTLSANDFSEEKVTIYPNPVKDIVNINLPQNTSIKSYEINDLLGKRVTFKNETQNSINVSELSDGIYLLKIETSEGMITKKFIKE